jgi:methyl-accepting chemotaxis protein
MIFKQLSVSTRIYAGFGLLIVIAMGLAGFGIDRLSGIAGQIGRLSFITDNTSRVQEATLRLESIRRGVAHYQLDATPAALKTMQDGMTETVALLQQLTDGANTEDRRRNYDSVREGIVSYRGLVDRLVAQQTRVTEQRAKLFTGGDALTAATDQLVLVAKTDDEAALTQFADAAERAVLTVRIANWRFLATNDPKGPATFETNRDKAEAAIAKLGQTTDGGTRAAIPPVEAALAAYARNFDAVATGLLTINELFRSELLPRIEAMQTEMRQAKTSLTATFADRRQATDDMISNANLLQVIMTAAALALGFALAFTIGRGIAGPIRAMTTVMSKLADGDTTVEIPARGSKDEIGDMARAVAVFQANLIKTNSLTIEQAAEQARKEVRQQVAGGHIATFDRSVRGLLETLTSASADMRTNAQSMSSTAEQTNQQAGTVSVAAELASANVQTMAAATEEMASSAAEIARQVTRSTTIAARAVDAARNTDRQVQGLADTAQKIEAVVAIISNIASQTNLLALNATIEAARAGDAGKGFAVVASEVKALASQTGRATEEIGAQIKAIQSATQGAVDAIKGIGTTIDEMNAISTAIAAAMEEQGATTAEMTRNTQEAARGTQEVSATISSVSQGAQATGSAANQVLAAASELGNKAASLRAEVDSFLNNMRAA